jgi:queuosine precursor transporter
MTKYGEEDLDILNDPGVRMPLQGLRKRSPVFVILTTILRLVVPVAALLGVFALAQYAEGHPVTAFDRYPSDQAERNLSAWLTGSHFVIPLSFFVIHLTNRAYGAGLALGQVLIAWTVLAAASVYFAPQLAEFLPWWRALPEASAPAFAISLLTGHLAAIAVFNMTRGPIWWKAPFYGGVIGSAVYVGLFYALAPLKEHAPFSLALATDGTINLSMAILLVLPYWMLRPVIRPLPGYGGA